MVGTSNLGSWNGYWFVMVIRHGISMEHWAPLKIFLVGGLEHFLIFPWGIMIPTDFHTVWNMNCIYPFSWKCHSTNWRTHIFQRGRYTTNQLWTTGHSCFWLQDFRGVLYLVYSILVLLCADQYFGQDFPCSGAISNLRFLLSFCCGVLCCF